MSADALDVSTLGSPGKKRSSRAKTDPPLISVITVVRNLRDEGRLDAIGEAIDSVQTQTFRSVEHIIHDGASTDGTISHIEERLVAVSSGIPATIHSEADDGIYDAMNRAALRSNGTYLLFLNSDDVIPSEDSLEALASHVPERRPDFVYGATLREREDGTYRLLDKMNLRAALQRMPFGHNAALYRRDTFEALGGFDTRFRIAADYDFILRMLAAGAVGQRAEVVASRFQLGGASSDDHAVAKDYAGIWRKFLSSYCDVSSYSEDEMIGWYRDGVMPMPVLASVLRSDASAAIKAAARHSLWRSFRRSLQPWRRDKRV